jgi:hypothetical protein
MAEETKTTVQEQETQQTETKPGSKKPETKNEEVNIQDLMLEVAKLKRQVDKASSEAAEWKKKYKASLDETEKASMEKAEAEAAKEEEINQLRRENTLNKVEKGYLALGWTGDEASRMAIAEVDGDFDNKAKIMAEVDARKKKEFETEFLKNRPELNVGLGDGRTYTKEQFDKMTPVELTKLKRENEAEYNRLLTL